MTKAKFWCDAAGWRKRFAAAGAAVLMAAVAGCSEGQVKHELATPIDIAALPYEFQLPSGFRSYDAENGRVVLMGSAQGDIVAPTIEIDIQLGRSEGEFLPEMLVLEHLSDLRAFKDFTVGKPEGSRLAGRTAVLITATATSKSDAKQVRLAQWVSKQGKGYARVVAYADGARFDAMWPDFQALVRSVQVQR